MPRKTFLNLSPQRQQEILNAGYREFANSDFQSASLSKVIKGLGLAKGSFYRYFDSKLDLYLHLYRSALAELPARVGRAFSDPSVDFFDEWLAFTESAIALDQEAPPFVAFLENFDDAVAKEHGLPMLHHIPSRVAQAQVIIERYKAAGSLRSDLPSEVMAHFSVFVRDAMRTWYRNGGSREGLDQLLECIRSGIGARATEGESSPRR